MVMSICVGITCLAEVIIDLSNLLFEFGIPSRLFELLSSKSHENKCYRPLLLALSSIVNSSKRWQILLLMKWDVLKYMLHGAHCVSLDNSQVQSDTMILTSCRICADMNEACMLRCFAAELDKCCVRVISGTGHNSAVRVAAEILCSMLPRMLFDNWHITALRAIRQCAQVNDMNCVLSVFTTIITLLQNLRCPPLTEQQKTLLRDLLHDEQFMTRVDSLSCCSQAPQVAEAADIIANLCNSLNTTMDGV